MTCASGLDLAMDNDGLAVFLVLLAIYFLPNFMAGFRKHHNGSAILVLNLFLGWTVLGWIVALIWASTKVEKSD
jgi:hypothetical protein